MTRPTIGLLNRLDPRQPSEAEVAAAAEELLDHFEGDVGRARLWAIDQAIAFDQSGDRTRNLVAVRLSRSLKP